ncbi:acyltransferase family protein [Dongia deserti]|uniref:acyltransferase family protein n=1 Tax=Dongia deserti TaxID=2268030 RepID=UPI000E657A41|nr:acyltransferase [Dongia deserti]
MKQRFKYIDRTKGLAILLVVLGHLIAREAPPGENVEWYMAVKGAIYTFHMPLFMAVSGLVYGFSWRQHATMADDLTDARRRIMRLLPAYLLIGLLVFVGKLTFQSFSPAVDNKVDGAAELLELLFAPTASFSSFLWYIYALSVIYLIFPLAFRAVGGRVVWLLLIAMIFWWLPSSRWFAWDMLQILSFFFLVGVIAGRHHDDTLRWLGLLWVPALMLFVVVVPAGSDDDPVAARWAAAALSVVAIPGFMRATESWHLGALDVLGRYTLIIYLTNTIFIGLVKVASYHLGFWHALYFPLIAITMTLVAIGGAMMLKRCFLPLVPPLDRITT